MKITDIRIDGGTQSRAALNEQAVQEYADALLAGDKLPAVSVCFDGSDNWLVDGFHRFHAHRLAGLDEIEAEVCTGTKREAVLLGATSNISHGLRRTNDDKRTAALTLLKDAEWSQWSDNQIAKMIGVSHPFVGSVRASLVTITSSQSKERVTATGAKMNTENIGKKPKKAAITPEKVDPPETLGGSGSHNDDAEEQAQAELEIAQMKADLALIAADDKLAHLMAENKRLLGVVATLESRIHGMQGKEGELIRKVKRLERELAKVGKKPE
jgi:hypothetical protein